MESEKATAGNLALPTDRLPSSLMSAIFDSISSPFETIRRKKSGGYSVGLSNVEDLYFRIEQIVQQYHLRGKRCEFVLSVEEGGVYRFTSLEKLQKANLTALNKEVTALGIHFDILIIPPKTTDDIEEPTSQRFKLEISIEDPFRAIEIADDYSFLGLKLRQQKVHSADIRIEYSDYAVSRTLLAVAEEWLDGLKTDTRDTISDRTRKRLAITSDNLSVALPLSAVVGGIIFEPANYANLFTPIRYLLFVILLAVIMIFVSVWTDERVSRLLYILTPKTSFSFSSGDGKKAAEILTMRKSAWRNLSVIFLGIILTGCVGLSVNFISQRIFG